MANLELVRWTPAAAVTPLEAKILKRCERHGRMFSFLRRHRLDLFDDAFQAELTSMYSDSPLGKPPLPPALLATVTLLQALTRESDAGAVEAAVLDRRWQMVLDCMDADEAPFSQGVLVDFRRRLVEHRLYDRLVERSVELAKKTGGFGYKQLRVALDSAPLWGAGRVEDTFNLIGHALAVVVACAAVAAKEDVETIRSAAGLTLLGGSSLKASLDIDWDDPDEQRRALQRLLDEVTKLKSWLLGRLKEEAERPPLKEALDQLERLIEQDIEPDPGGKGHQIKDGTARDRQISIGDPQMRHGRKSRSQTIKGFKRYVLRDLDHGLILGATVQPANQPERDAAITMKEQAARFGVVHEFHIDRGFLASNWTTELHEAGAKIYCRPWRSGPRDRFAKEVFRIDLERSVVTCPAGVSTPIRGSTAQFGKACAHCALRPQCTTAASGRSVHIHPQEKLLIELRAARSTPGGRARLRERVHVEHSLAHVCARQGRRARYVGVDNNLFDLCRYVVIENLFEADRAERRAA
jgi:hypothetical protein